MKVSKFDWVLSTATTFSLTYAGVYATAKFNDAQGHNAHWIALAFACLSMTVHRIVLLAKRYG